MSEPTAYDPATTPAMELGGRLWPVPELVWRDLRRCRKELLELNDRINAGVNASAEPVDEDAEARQLRRLSAMTSVFVDLSNEDYERLVMGPLHTAILAMHPTITREEFEGWRSTEAERQMAWLVLRRQSGLFIFTGVETASGEVDGAA